MVLWFLPVHTLICAEQAVKLGRRWYNRRGQTKAMGTIWGLFWLDSKNKRIIVSQGQKMHFIIFFHWFKLFLLDNNETALSSKHCEASNTYI